MATKVELFEVPVSPPLAVLAGDVLERDGDTLNVIRGGNVVASAALGPAEPIESGEITSPRTVSSLFQVEVTPMPGVAVTVNDVTVNQTTGAINAKFSDGNPLEFTDFEQLVGTVAPYDTDLLFAKHMLLLALVRREPDGSNLDALNGSSCTVDGTAAAPVQFSLNE